MMQESVLLSGILILKDNQKIKCKLVPSVKGFVFIDLLCHYSKIESIISIGRSRMDDLFERCVVINHINFPVEKRNVVCVKTTFNKANMYLNNAKKQMTKKESIDYTDLYSEFLWQRFLSVCMMNIKDLPNSKTYDLDIQNMFSGAIKTSSKNLQSKSKLFPNRLIELPDNTPIQML